MGSHIYEVPTVSTLWSGALPSPPLDTPGLAQRDTSTHAPALHPPVLTVLTSQHPSEPQGHGLFIIALSFVASVLPVLLSVIQRDIHMPSEELTHPRSLNKPI